MAQLSGLALLVAITGLLLLRLVAAVDIAVDLGYSTYVGRTQGDGVSQWLGIRYAAPPLGSLRFTPPQDPPVTTTLQPATQVSILAPKGKETVSSLTHLTAYSMGRSV